MRSPTHGKRGGWLHAPPNIRQVVRGTAHFPWHGRIRVWRWRWERRVGCMLIWRPERRPAPAPSLRPRARLRLRLPQPQPPRPALRKAREPEAAATRRVGWRPQPGDRCQLPSPAAVASCQRPNCGHTLPHPKSLLLSTRHPPPVYPTGHPSPLPTGHPLPFAHQSPLPLSHRPPLPPQSTRQLSPPQKLSSERVAAAPPT